MKSEPIFSGDGSTEFWKLVNSGPKRRALYAMACKCQELESAHDDLVRRVEAMERSWPATKQRLLDAAGAFDADAATECVTAAGAPVLCVCGHRENQHDSHGACGLIECPCGIFRPRTAPAADIRVFCPDCGGKGWPCKTCSGIGTVAPAADIGEIVQSLNEFAEQLQRGESIEATRVTRESTPDGPLHTFTKTTLSPPGADSGDTNVPCPICSEPVTIPRGHEHYCHKCDYAFETEAPLSPPGEAAVYDAKTCRAMAEIDQFTAFDKKLILSLIGQPLPAGSSEGGT